MDHYAIGLHMSTYNTTQPTAMHRAASDRDRTLRSTALHRPFHDGQVQTTQRNTEQVRVEDMADHRARNAQLSRLYYTGRPLCRCSCDPPQFSKALRTKH